MLVALGSMWGATYSISKLGILEGVPPLAYGFWQCLGAAVLLAAAVPLRRLAGGLGGWRALAFGAAAGQLGIFLPNVVFYYAVQHIPAGLMTVVVTVSVPCTYGFSLLLGLEAFQARRIAGLALGFVGVMILVGGGVALPAPGAYAWLLLSFLTPAFYAANAVFSGRFRPEGLSSHLLAIVMLASAATSQGVLMAALGQVWLPGEASLAANLSLASQIAVSAIAYVLYFETIRRAGPVFFSQVGYLIVATGLIWGYVFFGETFGPWLYVAAALILGGVALVNRRV
jgi:drug/metabolite transporter (DMT)-like permease